VRTFSRTRLKLRTGLVGLRPESIQEVVKRIEGNSVIAIEPVIWNPSEIDVSEMLSGLDALLVSSDLEPAELELWLETVQRKQPSVVILLLLEGPMDDGTRSLIERYECLPISDTDPDALPPGEIGDILASALILRSLLDDNDGIISWGGYFCGFHC